MKIYGKLNATAGFYSSRSTDQYLQDEKLDKWISIRKLNHFFYNVRNLSKKKPFGLVSRQ